MSAPVNTSQARLAMEQVAGLPPAQALRLNTWLRDSAYLKRSEISAGYPAIFEIEPTNICAMRCVHCPRPTRLRRKGEHMSPAMLERTASQIHRYAQNLFAAAGDQMLAVNFMHYGEPALTPHYALGIGLLKRLGLRVVSSSTSSEFTEQAARAAVENGLDELWFIFDGLDDATFQRMRGPRASFAAGLDNLRRLQALKAEAAAPSPDIVAVMIRHPYNRHQWDAFAEFFGNWPGIRHYLGNLSVFNGAHADVVRHMEELGDDPATQEEQARVAALNAHPCRYPWHSVSVLADGRVVPCCRDINGDMVLGDLRRHNLAEIWNGPALRELRRRFARNDKDIPLCRACREASLEIGVPRELDEAAEREALALLGQDATETNA